MADDTTTEESGKARALMREVATIASDPSYPAFDGLLRPNDDTLATRGGAKGLKIYAELERDTRVHSVMQKRQTAVAEREWYVAPASERPRDKQAAEVCETALTRMNFDKLTVDLLDALLKGYAVVELMPVYRDGLWLIGEAIARDQQRFVFNDKRQLRLLTRREMVHGVPVPPRKFIVHSHGGKDGNPNGLGLGSKLFWPVFFKRQGIQFWLVLADRYGNPTTMGSYPQSADEGEIDKILRAMQALSHDGVIAKPEGWTIELLEATKAGNVTTHEQLCRYMDEQIAECVLGETLTTNIGGAGSRAAAETHNDVREILVKFDADMLSATLNRTLMRWLTEWNLGFDAAPPTVWRQFTEEEDLNQRVKRDSALARMGWHMTEEKFAETYGDGYVYRPPRAPAAAAPPPAEGADAPGSDSAFAEAERDQVDDLTDQLDAAAAPATDALIGRLRAELEEADNLEAFSERLPALFAEMGEDGLADAIRRGLVTADLMGRHDIEQGAGDDDA